MAYHIALTDDDYAALLAAASQRGESVETALHNAIARQYPMSTSAHQQQGTYSYPTGAPINPALRAEMEQLATQLGGERPWLSEMVIDDRGPR